MKSKIKSRPSSGMSAGSAFPRSNRKKHSHKKLWLIALPVTAGLLPHVALAQTGNLIFQVTAGDFNVSTGALTPDVGPVGMITSPGSVSIEANATPNNMPALSFNGTGGFGLSSAINESSNAVTIFAVVLPSYNSSNGNAETIVSGGPGSLQYRIDAAGTNLGEPAFLDRDQFQFGNSSVPVSQTSYSVIDAMLTPNTSAPNGVNFYTNGVRVGDNGGYGFNIGGITAFGAADNATGTYPNDSYNEFFNGTIAEVQVYDGDLSTTQRQTIENSLAASFGIQFTNPNFNWNAGTGLFTTGSNWDQGTAPSTSLQFATISNGGTAQIVSGNSIAVGGLTVGSNTSTGVGNVTHTGGDLAVSGTLGIGSNGGTGFYNLSGGTITAQDLYIGNVGTGTLLQSAGTVTVTNDFQVGLNAGVGTFNMTGGTVNYSGGNFIRILGSPTPSSITLSGNATLNDTGGAPFIGVDNNGTAVLNVTGNATLSASNGIDLAYIGCTGILNVSGNATVTSGGDMLIGWNGYGIINMMGGSLTEAGTMHFGYAGTSLLNQTGGNITLTSGGFNVLMAEFAPGNTTFNISGGVFNDSTGSTAVGYRGPSTVNLGGGAGTAQYITSQMQLGIVAGQGSGVLNLNTNGILTTNSLEPAAGGGTVSFNGGTLQALSNTGGLLTGFSNGQVTAGTSGAIIDTQNFTATITAPISGPGALIKVGGGTLVMGGSSTYSGATKINAGKLQLQAPSLNLSFEIPANAGGANYAPTGAAWIFSGGGSLTGSGITDGTAFNFNGAPPDGTQAAFIQMGGYISQSFNFPTTGTYSLTFYTEQRPGQDQNLDVQVDPSANGPAQDLSQGGFYPTANWAPVTYTFNVSAGSHVIQFAGLDTTGGDNTAYVDDISFSPGVGSTQNTISNALPSTSPIVIADNATFDVNGETATVGSLTGTSLSTITLGSGTLTIGADNTNTTFAGNMSDGGMVGSLIKIGTGIQTLSGSNSYTGQTNVSGGTLVFTGAHSFPAGTAAIIGLGATLVLPSQTAFSSATSVNVNGNLIVHNGSIGAITALAAAAYNGGAWNGPSALTSTAAASDTTYLTALGVIPVTTQTSFEGQSVAVGDVLVKYTYYGDTNLDGVVDGSDYSRIDTAFINNQNTHLAKLTGWYNGDFNYDGAIDGSDYTLIDNAFNSQGAPFAALVAGPTAQIGTVTTTAAVPEPTSLAVLGISVAGLLSRRARFRRRL